MTDQEKQFLRGISALLTTEAYAAICKDCRITLDEGQVFLDKRHLTVTITEQESVAEVPKIGPKEDGKVQ